MSPREALDYQLAARRGVPDHHSSTVSPIQAWVSFFPAVVPKGVRREIQLAHWYNYDSITKFLEVRFLFADPGLPPEMKLTLQGTGAGAAEILPGKFTLTENWNVLVDLPLRPGDDFQHKMTTNKTTTEPVCYCSWIDYQ